MRYLIYAALVILIAIAPKQWLFICAVDPHDEIGYHLYGRRWTLTLIWKILDWTGVRSMV